MGAIQRNTQDTTSLTKDQVEKLLIKK